MNLGLPMKGDRETLNRPSSGEDNARHVHGRMVNRKKPFKISRRTLRLVGEIVFVLLAGAIILLGSAWFVSGKLEAMEQRITVQNQNELKEAIGRLQEESQETLGRMEERMETMAEGLLEMNDILAGTDQSLDASASTSQQLREQMDSLEEQLKELEASLELLRQRP